MKSFRTLLAACSGMLVLVVLVALTWASEGDRIEGLQSGQLPPPKILSPSDRMEIRGIFKMSFSWGDVPKATGYHVVLARDRRFRNVVYENIRIPETSCIAENLTYGTYFYRISSVAENGSEGPFSEVRSFIIVPSLPSLPVK